MRAGINAHHAQSAGAQGLGQEFSAEEGIQPGLIGVSSDLVAQLGLECFALEVSAIEFDAKAGLFPATGSTPSHLPTVVSASEHTPHDFWEEVALLSSLGSTAPPNVMGIKHDWVAHAIATVSAKYAVVPVEPRLTSLSGAHAGATNAYRSVSVGPQNNGSSSAVTDKSARSNECDLVSILESFYDFEANGELSHVAQLDPAVFDLVRQRAASAVLAANVIRDAALKAVEGRKG